MLKAFKKRSNDAISEEVVKDMTKSSNSFFKWIQEYSKKIITITFIIFVLINLYCLIMTAYVFQVAGEFQSLDTLITEVHQTFREVVGGYIIKAAVENVSKYSGVIIEKWLDLKLEREISKRVADDGSEIMERDGLLWKKQEQ